MESTGPSPDARKTIARTPSKHSAPAISLASKYSNVAADGITDESSDVVSSDTRWSESELKRTRRALNRALKIGREMRHSSSVLSATNLESKSNASGLPALMFDPLGPLIERMLKIYEYETRNGLR